MLRVFVLIFAGAPAAYADSFICNLEPDGRAPPLLGQVELWVESDTWHGQMRDAASKTVSPNRMDADVKALGPQKWEFNGKMTGVDLGDNSSTKYIYRYRLNTKNLTVNYGGTFIGSDVHVIETGASGTCRKTR